MSVRMSSIELFTRPRDPCLGSCQRDVGIPEYGPMYRGSTSTNAHYKPITDEQVFYDKCTCSKASMLAFEQVHLS